MAVKNPNFHAPKQLGHADGRLMVDQPINLIVMWSSLNSIPVMMVVAKTSGGYCIPENDETSGEKWGEKDDRRGFCFPRRRNCSWKTQQKREFTSMDGLAIGWCYEVILSSDILRHGF